MSNPLSNPEDYIQPRIAWQYGPGFVVCKGWSRPHAWEKKGGKGQKGQSIELINLPLANGSFTWHLWKDAHFIAWDVYARILVVDPTKKSTHALDIYYPTLARIGVKSIVIEDIGQENTTPQGLTTIEVKMVEYAPPPKKPANAAPSGSKTNSPSVHNVTGGSGDPAADALQKQIAELARKAGLTA